MPCPHDASGAYSVHCRCRSVIPITYPLWPLLLSPSSPGTCADSILPVSISGCQFSFVTLSLPVELLIPISHISALDQICLALAASASSKRLCFVSRFPAWLGTDFSGALCFRDSHTAALAGVTVYRSLSWWKLPRGPPRSYIHRGGIHSTRYSYRANPSGTARLAVWPWIHSVFICGAVLQLQQRLHPGSFIAQVCPKEKPAKLCCGCLLYEPRAKGLVEEREAKISNSGGG